MTTWGEQLDELNAKWSLPQGGYDIDGMRRHYLNSLFALTGRNVVVYSTNWMSGMPGESSIVLNDVHGLMEVFKDLDASLGLDLILHSPGGDATAADSLVRYMREKFDDVRVIVPVAAMSAATLWALAADKLVLGSHSQLGPIDPQLVTQLGMVPAGAISRTFERAQEECAKDPSRLSGWVPTLQQYFPGLLDICADSTMLAKSLAEEYLRENMFRGVDRGPELAAAAAEYFADDKVHIAHGRGIHRKKLEALNLVVEPLEADDAFQDAVLSVHHAYMHTFGLNGAVSKIIENHIGRAVVRFAQQMVAPPGAPMMPQPA